jgi:flagellar hook-basal body complex protein FliE
MAIQGISSINGLVSATPIKSTNQAQEAANFKDLLMDALNNVNTLEQESAKMTEDFIAGRTDNIHSVMIAGEKATVALQFVMEVRNKVLDAYQEIMRMQV